MCSLPAYVSSFISKNKMSTRDLTHNEPRYAAHSTNVGWGASGGHMAISLSLVGYLQQIQTCTKPSVVRNCEHSCSNVFQGRTSVLFSVRRAGLWLPKAASQGIAKPPRTTFGLIMVWPETKQQKRGTFEKERENIGNAKPAPGLLRIAPASQWK